MRDLPLGETALGGLRNWRRASHNRCIPQRAFREPLLAEPLCASSTPPTRDLRLQNPQPPHLKNSTRAHALLSRNSPLRKQRAHVALRGTNVLLGETRRVRRLRPTSPPRVRVGLAGTAETKPTSVSICSRPPRHPSQETRCTSPLHPCRRIHSP